MSADDADSPQQEHAGQSAQDAQAFAQRLRLAPAEEILTEVLSTLLSTAQVKLGRRDARLFIDLCAGMNDHARDALSDDLRGQVDAALGQLRMGQVAAEREVAADGEPEPNDLPYAPPEPAHGAGRPQASSVDSAGSASGLWIPGR